MGTETHNELISNTVDTLIQETLRLQRRIFLLNGWARYMAGEGSLRDAMQHVKTMRAFKGFGGRDGNFGILVNDDDWARQYQRLHFRLQRPHYAVGAYGMRAHSSIAEEGGELVFRQHDVSEANRNSFAKIRERAFCAKHALDDKRNPLFVVDDASI